MNPAANFPYFAVLLFASDESRPVGVALVPAHTTARARLADYFDAWRMVERLFPQPGELAGLEAHVNASRAFFNLRYGDRSVEIDVYEAIHHGLYMPRTSIPVTYDFLRNSYEPVRVDISSQLQQRLDEFGGMWRARIHNVSGTEPAVPGVTFLEYESDESTTQLESSQVTEAQLIELFGPFPPHRLERI